ncbi:hypothetical protein GCM10027343_32530 [Noviherbaspirillum agri]
MIVAAWLALLGELDRDKRVHEETALREARILSRTYAGHLQKTLEAVDRIALYLRHAYALSEGTFRLENIDEAGLLPNNADFVAAILDRDGTVVTTSRPAAQPGDLYEEPFFLAQKESLKDELFIGPVRYGISTRRNAVHFSRKLVDETGAFSGIVLVSVVPDYFIAGYEEIALAKTGLLAILGVDRSIRVTRIGDTVYSPNAQALLKPLPPTAAASGSVFLDGEEWFSDRRNRYVGWHTTDAYGMVTVAGIDQQQALAPYAEHRQTWISHARWASAGLAAFSLIAMCLSWRLLDKQEQIEGLRATYRVATEGGSEGFYIARTVRNQEGHICDFRIVDCNHRGAELFNRRREEMVGKTITAIYGNDTGKRALDVLREACEKGVYEGEQEQTPDGPVKAKWLHLRVVRADGDLAVTLRDITGLKEHVIALERRGNEDVLTGLPNRNWVKDYLPGVVRSARENGKMLATLFIDLDGFKAVNDTMGHDAGDELLRNAARRLKVAVRPHDHVVRLGGDEFVVILETIEHKGDAAHVAERILAGFREPFRLSKGAHSVGTSIGISIFPDDAQDAESLLKHADVAMYSVKSAGKRSYRFFDQKFYDAVRVRHEQEAELRHALEQNEFIVFYQPRVNMATGAVSSMEALVRWTHPEKGIIEPAEFIPLAEETGLIVPLGAKVIDAVCAQLAYWQKRGGDLVPVSINVSARQFESGELVAELRRALARHRLDSKLVELEITESSMMADSEAVVETLAALRKMGVKLAVDDFGSGHSSLSRLQKLDLDVLKVDNVFTAGLEKTGEGRILFNAIVTMAHSLGMRVVAEGVESAEQLQMLKALECDEAQGFYISRPHPPSEEQLGVPGLPATALI